VGKKQYDPTFGSAKREVIGEPRFTVERIVSVLKEAELCLPVADLIRRVGITERTYYRWKRQ